MFQDLREWIRTEIKLHRAQRDLLCTKKKIDLDKVMKEQAWDKVPAELYQHIIAVSVFASVANFMDNYPEAIETGMSFKDSSAVIGRNFFEAVMAKEKEEKYVIRDSSLANMDEITQARILMRQWFAKHSEISDDGKVVAIKKG